MSHKEVAIRAKLTDTVIRILETGLNDHDIALDSAEWAHTLQHSHDWTMALCEALLLFPELEWRLNIRMRKQGDGGNEPHRALLSFRRT